MNIPPSSIEKSAFKLLESAFDASIATDQAGIIVFINRTGIAVFGANESEFIGQHINTLLCDGYQIPQNSPLNDLVDSPTNRAAIEPGREIFAIRNDASVFPALLLVSVIETDADPYFLFSIRDLSKQKQHEKKAALLENRLANAQRIAKLGNWEWNIPSGDLWWSDEIYSIFGYDREEFGATYEAFLAAVYPEDRAGVEAAVEKAISSRGLYSIRHRVIRPDGTIRIVQEQGEVECDSTDEPLFMHGTVQDITDQVITEQQLHKALRLESVGRLTGGIAHDFNNLLGVIIGNLDLLKLQTSSSTETKLLDTALSAAGKGSELVRRLLTFSKSQSLNPEKVDIGKLTRDLQELLTRTLPSSIEIAFDIRDQECCCEIDSSEFERAVLNLTINARDAMPDGGQISYRVYREKHAVETYQGGAKISPGSYVCFEITDSGTGISEQVLDHIFEPFFTTKETDKGTGLGLSMVFGFVEQSGGTLCLDTELGKGTAIRLLFPSATSSS